MSKQQRTQHQTKIHDSKSFIFILQLFNDQIALGTLSSSLKQKQHNINPYICVSTFDSYFTIKIINPKLISWTHLYLLRTVLPVIKSFIQFNQLFQPKSLVIAYIDGSIQYSEWIFIQKNYKYQIQCAENRKQTQQQYLKILEKSERKRYLNNIIINSLNMPNIMTLETVCFLHKKDNYIYSINLNGVLKIYQITQEKDLILKLYHKFRFRVTCALYIPPDNHQQKNKIKVAICFQKTLCPFIFQLNPQIKQQILQKKLLQFMKKYVQQQDRQFIYTFKLITYDCFSHTLIACTDQNQIHFYSIQKAQINEQESKRKYIFQMVYIQYIFKIPLNNKQIIQQKQNVQVIDLSIKNQKLLISTNKKYHQMDIVLKNIVMQEALKAELRYGKIIDFNQNQKKNLLLINKKADYNDPQTKKSTTLHLFTGKPIKR